MSDRGLRRKPKIALSRESKGNVISLDRAKSFYKGLGLPAYIYDNLSDFDSVNIRYVGNGKFFQVSIKAKIHNRTQAH